MLCKIIVYRKDFSKILIQRYSNNLSPPPPLPTPFLFPSTKRDCRDIVFLELDFFFSQILSRAFEYGVVSRKSETLIVRIFSLGTPYIHIHIRARAYPSGEREAPIRERERARNTVYAYTLMQTRSTVERDTHTHTHTHGAEANKEKNPSDQQCGNSERLRAALYESRTTRAATNDLLIYLSLRSLRARSP